MIFILALLVAAAWLLVNLIYLICVRGSGSILRYVLVVDLPCSLTACLHCEWLAKLGFFDQEAKVLGEQRGFFLRLRDAFW
jgi:hypothetical protein